jgi:hypothetical protein
MERTNDNLLELIPVEELSAKQKALRSNASLEDVPFYRLTKSPTHFDKIDWKEYPKMGLWCDEGVALVTYYPPPQYSIREHLVKWALIPSLMKRNVCLTLSDFEQRCSLFVFIYGETDVEVAETTVSFLSLPHSNTEHDMLQIGTEWNNISVFNNISEFNNFDVSALRPDHLAQILDAHCKKNLEVATGTWTAEQSVILATQPYPLKLRLSKAQEESRHGFRFSDGGKAFVDGLLERKSTFGSLILDQDPFSGDSKRQLFTKVTTIDKIIIFCPLEEEYAILPLSVKVNALEHKIDVKHLQKTDPGSLKVIAKDVKLKVFSEDASDGWGDIHASLLNRLADLGHLETLTYSIDFQDRDIMHHQDPVEIECVARAVARLVLGNPDLSYLNLSDCDWSINWGFHLQLIFQAMEDHRALREFFILYYPEEDANYSWIEKLVRKNYRIMAQDLQFSIFNQPHIIKIYDRNLFYQETEDLVTESYSKRSLLITLALTEGASQNFQLTFFVLHYHLDLLCELF